VSEFDREASIMRHWATRRYCTTEKKKLFNGLSIKTNVNIHYRLTVSLFLLSGMSPLRILRPLRTRDYTNKCFPLMQEKCSETRIGDSQVINTILPTAICICQPSVTVHWSNIFNIVSLPFKHMPSCLLRHAHGVEDNTKDYNVCLSRTLLLLLLVNKMRTVSHKHNPLSCA